MSEKKLEIGWRHLTIVQNWKIIKLIPEELQLQRSQTKQLTAIHGVLPLLWCDSAVADWVCCRLVYGQLMLLW